MALQSLDITARSATTTPSPGVRETQKVAKLIDISKCIGCKACQVACMEWNDLRDEIGTNHGVYDNPLDLTDKSWTVMRFSEVEVEKGKLEWLIRKDGCMHCADPGCLKACPAPGAIVQYSNGIVDFHEENCIGCGHGLFALRNRGTEGDGRRLEREPALTLTRRRRRLHEGRRSDRALPPGGPRQPLADRDYLHPARTVRPGAVPPGVFLPEPSLWGRAVDAHSASVHRRRDGRLLLLSGTSLLRGQFHDRSRLAMGAPAS